MIIKYTQYLSLVVSMVGSFLSSNPLLAETVKDKPVVTPTIQPSIQLVLSTQADSPISLEVRQMPLGKILNEIASKTGAIFHYSALPEAPVTATCAGTNVWQLMDCLLAKQIGLVANKPEPGKPAEFWLLGSSVGSCQTLTIESTPVSIKTESGIDNSQRKPEPPNKEYSDALLTGLKEAKTAEERKNALSYLTAGANINDPNVRAALTEAMGDKNPTIRSQALSSMAALDKDNAKEIISRGLQDTDSSVRMAAIESAANNQDLLEQAQNDSDKSVSNYAADKLGMLLRYRERNGQQ